VSIIFDSQKT